MHIVDTLETEPVRRQGAAQAPGRPRFARAITLAAKVDFDPYRSPDFGRLIEAWLPLTFAMNSLNRSMGQPDLYPFRMTPATIGKLPRA